MQTNKKPRSVIQDSIDHHKDFLDTFSDVIKLLNKVQQSFVDINNGIEVSGSIIASDIQAVRKHKSFNQFQVALLDDLSDLREIEKIMTSKHTSNESVKTFISQNQDKIGYLEYLKGVLDVVNCEDIDGIEELQDTVCELQANMDYNQNLKMQEEVQKVSPTLTLQYTLPSSTTSLKAFQPIAQKFKETRKNNWGEKQKPVSRGVSIASNEEEKKHSTSRSVVQRDERSGSRTRDSKFAGMSGVTEKRGVSGQRALVIGNLAVAQDTHPTSFGPMSKSLKEKQKASQLCHTDQLAKRDESLNKKFSNMGIKRK